MDVESNLIQFSAFIFSVFRYLSHIFIQTRNYNYIFIYMRGSISWQFEKL